MEPARPTGRCRASRPGVRCSATFDPVVLALAVGGVGVNVDEAGENSLTLQVDGAGAVDLAHVTDPGELAVGDLERADELLLVAHGEDLTVDEDLFVGGGHGYRSSLCGCECCRSAVLGPIILGSTLPGRWCPPTVR